MKYQLQDFRCIDISSIRRSIGAAASRSRLNASYDGPVSRFFDGASFALCHLDGSFVIEKSRICHALLDHFRALADQRFRRTVKDSHRQYRLLGLQICCCIQAEIR